MGMGGLTQALGMGMGGGAGAAPGMTPGQRAVEGVQASFKPGGLLSEAFARMGLKKRKKKGQLAPAAAGLALAAPSSEAGVAQPAIVPPGAYS